MPPSARLLSETPGFSGQLSAYPLLFLKLDFEIGELHCNESDAEQVFFRFLYCVLEDLVHVLDLGLLLSPLGLACSIL